MRGKKIVLWMAILMGFLLLGRKDIKAASTQKLKENYTYRTTLTGKNIHTLRYTYRMQDNGYLLNAADFYIDGRLTKSITGSELFYMDVRLCQIGTKRTLICVTGITSNDYSEFIHVYEYKKKKMKKIADLTEITRNRSDTNDKFLSGWARGEVSRAGKKRITLRWTDTQRSTGIVMLDIHYKIQGSKVTRMNNTYSVRDSNRKIFPKWTANQTITVYSKPGAGRVVYEIHAGDQVKVLKMTRRKKIVYFQVENESGQTGWYQELNRIGAYFEEAIYAG